MNIDFRAISTAKIFKLLNFKSFFLNKFYDFKSNKVIEPIDYKITGSCKQCGECCKKIFNTNLYYKSEFDLIKKFCKSLKRFEVIGKDQHKRLVLRCNLLGKDNKCTDYENRLNFCKAYPFDRLQGGVLLKDCGFKKEPVKKFKNYLISGDISRIY